MTSGTYGLTEVELRQVCRTRLEMLEAWLKRLIEQRILEVYGGTVADAKRSNGEHVVKTSIRSLISAKVSSEPDRYKRSIDATKLEDLITIICHPQTFRDCFHDALKAAFPLGDNEARDFLSRLTDSRNRLSHDNPISLRQAEQVICYSGDVIASIRGYYEEMGNTSEFNVPRIIRYWDSLGNVIHADLTKTGINQVVMPRTADKQLRPGDVLTIEVEIDPSFVAEGFNVAWQFPNSFPHLAGEQMTRVSMPIEAKHVSEHMVAFIQIRSHRDWHRLNHCDDQWEVIYRVLPPV